jgi:hypothetical protein
MLRLGAIRRRDMSELLKLLKSMVGQPAEHEQDKKDPGKALIQAPEFDITQYAKKLGVVVGVLVPAVLGALKAANVDVSTPIMIATLGVTAAALLGVSFVVAADILGRVYADRSAKWSLGSDAASGATAGRPGAAAGGHAGAAGAPGGPEALMTVWVSGGTEACPVIAIERGESETSYLILQGSTSRKQLGGREVEVYDGRPTWIEESEIAACAVAPPSAATAEAVAGRRDGA